MVSEIKQFRKLYKQIKKMEALHLSRVLRLEEISEILLISRIANVNLFNRCPIEM